MIKYIITSWLVFVPFVSMAADHCTNPTEYTVDKRCYVTDEQKKTSPYNAVVGLAVVDWLGWVDIYCTGTIVKGRSGDPYLYTAKHCISDKNNIKIKLQDGRLLKVTESSIGNYDAANEENLSGDWATYSIDKVSASISLLGGPKVRFARDLPMVEKSSNAKVVMGPYDPVYDARVVGYGALKIMSDKEISNYKDKYIRYLKDKQGITAKGDERQYGFDGEGGVRAYYDVASSGPYVVDFLNDLARNDRKYYLDVFDNIKELKVSSCGFSASGRHVGCQGWGGNSGGPIFDNKGKIMGIHTRGFNRMIGGEHHAGKQYFEDARTIDSVNLLKERKGSS